ncbi:unnamed protein product, partial [Discosporangium mesarthrocarpum]
LGSRWKLFLFSPTLSCQRISELLNLSVKRYCSPKYMRVFAPTNGKIDGWASALGVKDHSPASFELAVTANLREVLYTMKARVLVMLDEGRGGVGEGGGKGGYGGRGGMWDGGVGAGMTSVALQRAVAQASASCNEW